MHLKSNTLHKKIFILLMVSVMILLGIDSQTVYAAGITSDNAFDNAVWELVLEDPVHAPTGVVQAVCATDKYIVCLENTSDHTDEADTLTAYYKTDLDENGKKVKPYSVAKTVKERNYEHANGLAYNPKTNEILISGYTNSIPENRGCLFIIDADTLEYKTQVQVSPHYNILGVGYNPDTDQYVIQTNDMGDYNYKLLDSNFQIIDELGEFNLQNEGSNYQDLCVSGDYFMNFPLTLSMGIGNFIHMYSISRKAQVSSAQVNIAFEDDVAYEEPESICEVNPGEFLAVFTVTFKDQSRVLRLYKTTVPYAFSVTTSGENGTVSQSDTEIQRGEDYTVTYTPNDKYQVSHLIVDGKKMKADKHPESYTFKNVQGNHTIQVVFDKISVAATDKKASSSILLRSVIICMLAIALLSFLLYVRMVRVRRIRAAKIERARRRRERYIREYYE